MRLLESKRLNLPKVFFISNREEIKDLPIGIPFIFGDENSENYLIRMLEYEVLWQSAMKTKYPFNFKKLLKENGFIDIQDFEYSHPLYLEFTTDKFISEFEINGELSLPLIESQTCKLKDYVRDSSCIVDIEKLKSLNVFPVWLNQIEDAVKVNIHNYATFNSNMYNKKLDGFYGALEMTSPNRNLIIIDISGSIPKQVSSTCLTLAKNLVETFYADLMITGSITTLYPYEEIHLFDISTAYEVNGMGNESLHYRKLVTSDVRNYETVIAFGDNHSPCDLWNSKNHISEEDAKKICKWNVKKLISFHTSSDKEIAGYATFFSPLEIEKVKNWVSYLN